MIANTLKLCGMRACGPFIVAACVVSFGCRRTSPAQGSVLASLAARFPCRSGLPTNSSSVPNLTKPEVCGLVGAALASVAGLQKHEGMPQPGDTAAIAAARVTQTAELKFNGDTVASWWLVTLRLPSRPYDVDVRIDKRNGSAEPMRVHKPLGSQ